jgi:hypothetical protein
MPSYKKGNFVIKGSEGVTTLAGLAALTNDALSTSFSDGTAVMEHRDAGNVPRTLTKDFDESMLTFRITPGIGSGLASQAAVAAAIASLKKGDTFTSSGFEDSQFNLSSGDKAIIWEVGKSLVQGDLMSVDVTVRKLTETGGTAIDFTAAWSTL